MPQASSDEITTHSFSQPFQATCPQCDQEVNLEVWLIVDLAERPDLAERIRQGALHKAPCPHCDHAGQMDVPLLLYLPGREPPLLFSPAQNSTTEQDHAHAADLIQQLQETFLN